jgi:hypothetical protein
VRENDFESENMLLNCIEKWKNGEMEKRRLSVPLITALK